MRIVVIGGGPAGLYFSILMKKQWPDHDITVYERNRPDDTFGFGVVFSDATLGNFQTYDAASYEAITRAFAYWDKIDFVLHGETIRSSGHGFCGCERKELLLILEDRCQTLGVELIFETEIDDLDQFADANLIVGADGINSFVRERHAGAFQPVIDWRRNRFIWLGSTKPLDAFTFDFVTNNHGIWVLGAYQHTADMSTWIVEAPEKTWASAEAEVGSLGEAEIVSYMQDLWAPRLDGHRMISNKSVWRQFPIVRNAQWHTGNIVLLGDALHTAHYSIGSGTKLAMEDAIALYETFRATDTVAAALPRFEEIRRDEVERTQHAGDISVVWTENPERYWKMEPTQAAYSMLTRSKEITHENLRLRDAAFIARVEEWWNQHARRNHDQNLPNNTPPMFSPYQIGELTVTNRVIVSPMDMYAADDGTVGDFHFVHLGSLALGGAGLVYSEMACVSRDGRITPGCSGLYKAEHAAAWRRVIDFVHDQSDAKFCMQIGHAGRKGSTRLACEGIDLPLQSGNWPLVAPSPLPFLPESQTPHEMTKNDMTAVTADFASATEMAAKAGADMLEVHMAHGYLLSSFITPVSNQRTDAYGGILENRMRFPLKVLQVVREAWPKERPISVRISATDWVGSNGLEADEAVEIARMLVANGCDIVNVSTGQTTPDAEPVYGRMYQAWFSEQVRMEARTPTITAGNITSWDQINTILVAGRADLVALARPHLTNPHFTLQAAAYFGHDLQRWPIAYNSAKEQAYRLALRDRNDEQNLKLAARPPSHQRG